MEVEFVRASLSDAFIYCFKNIAYRNDMKRFDHGQDQMVSECILNYVDIARNLSLEMNK